MTIHKFPGFATPEDCAEVVKASEAIWPAAALTTGVEFWDHRVVFAEAFERRFRSAAAALILRKWETRALDAASGVVGCPVENDGLSVVRWPEGYEQVPHYDEHHEDGTPHDFPWREWAGLLYLNDDFEGGEIHFPAAGLEIKPEPGLFVLFPGAELHGVRKIESGTRWTVPQWFKRAERR